MLRELIDKGSWTDAKQLLEQVKKYGKTMSRADKMNFTVGNTVKRVYHIIRTQLKLNHVAKTNVRSIMSGSNDTSL